jgi:hypothetical protein
MSEEAKLALFDALVAYLIQSSAAINVTIRAIASGSPVSPLDLDKALDTAKVLLSQVILGFI